MIKKLAGAYCRKNQIMIHPCHKTQSGFFVADSPYITLSKNVDHLEIGNAILKVLEASESSIPDPDYSSDLWKQSDKDRFNSMGVKSEKDFIKDAKHVSINEDDEGNIHFVPTNNGGSSGEQKGFHHLSELNSVISKVASPKDIGSKLVEAFDVSI
jgi:hypothetical protein